jgi:hypothetical protein
MTSILIGTLLLISQENADALTLPPISAPTTVSAGEEFQVVYMDPEADVVLQAIYPGARMDWLFEPNDQIDQGWRFDMKAPYAGANLTIRFLGWKEINGTSVLGVLVEWFEIEVTGWIDEDGDSISDTWEDLHGLKTDDPNEDEDEDGVILLEEMYHLTDPEEVDSDHDSMDDIWEITNGTIPFVDDTNLDPDRDSWSNIQEMVKGTDPRDPEDHPERPPVTPWYWIVIIVGVLLLILSYFVRQLFSKKKLEDDLDEFDRNNRKGSQRARDISDKV